METLEPGGLSKEHISFLIRRSVPFLKHWPIECLASNPQSCMFHFFSRGQVLVRDSNHSDWIYVVKSGSLSVLKKLVEVEPRVQHIAKDDNEENTSFNSKSFGTWDFRLKIPHRLKTTEEKEVFKNNLEMEKRLEQTLPGYYNVRERLGTIDYDEIVNDHKTRVLPNTRKPSGPGTPLSLPKLTPDMSDSVYDDSKDTDTDTLPPEADDRMLKLPKIRKTSKGAYLVSTKSNNKRMSRKEAIQEEIFTKQLEYDTKVSQTKKVGRKTITDDFDNKMIKDFSLTEKDVRPMFVQVQILERGQHFGLTKTVFPEQAESFSVVSNGAECIMISKRFFLEKANEATMYHLRQVETLLPDEEELQRDLQDFVDWKCHRAKVYNRLVRDKESRIGRHSQFPPQYGGQYSFRTGPIVRN